MRTKTEVRPEHVLEAGYVRPEQLFLRFADGLEGTWTFHQLALDMSNVKLSTVQASSTGTTVEMKSKWDETVELDASALRSSIDPAYAA